MTYDDDYDSDDYLDGDRARRYSGRHPLQDPSLVQAFLAQGDAWMTVGGQYVAIADMTPGHALATANFVLERARATTLTLLAIRDERVTEGLLCEDEGSRRLLIDTTLVKALIERGRDSAATELPWASVARR